MSIVRITLGKTDTLPQAHSTITIQLTLEKRAQAESSSLNHIQINWL